MRHRNTTFLVGLIVLVGGGCNSPSDVSGSTSAVIGGAPATASFYDAVLCGPRTTDPASPSEPGHPMTGWEQTNGRCEINTTLITPTLGVNVPYRLYWQDLEWEVGHRTAFANYPVETQSTPAYTGREFGSGLTPLPGPTERRYGVAFYEVRASGVATWCPHPFVRSGPSAEFPGRWYVPPESEWDRFLPSRYHPDDPAADTHCPDQPDELHCRASLALPGSECRGGAECSDDSGCAGVAGSRCCTLALDNPARWHQFGVNSCVDGPSRCSTTCASPCSWGADVRGVPLCRHPAKDAGGASFDTYRQYLRACADPLAADDTPLGDAAFVQFARPITTITPISFPLEYPDSTTSPDAILGMLGDVVGYGSGGGVPEGTTRQVAVASTAILSASAITRLLADGSSLVDTTRFLGDNQSNGGAGHLDFGAPLLLPSGGSAGSFVFAVNQIGTNFPGAPDTVYTVPLTDQTAAGLRAFLDPDGDGIQRGFVDAPGTGIIDADGDGFSEYRVITGMPGADCIEAVPPLSGQCWAPTRNDNCGAPRGSSNPGAYANADQFDLDGDGAGDACDVCPVNWDRDQATCTTNRVIAAVESPTGLEIPLGGQLGLACSRLNPAWNVDLDADGFMDGVCDNCPPPPGSGPFVTMSRYANPNQSDRDGDGVGDACDLCPDDPGSGTGDADHDGVGDACDNCPSIANGGQANCNLDSERVAQLSDPMAPILGDACDPNPCPSFTRTGGNRSTGPNTFETWNSSITGRGLVDENEGTLRTGLRFCPCATASEDTPEARDACRVVSDCKLEFGEFDDDPGDTFWNRPSISWPGQVQIPDAYGNAHAVVRYAELGSPNARSFWTSWRFEPDAAAWGAITEINALFARAPGVIWAHGSNYQARYVPATPPDPPVLDPFACPSSGSCPAADRDLTSHYWSGELERLGQLQRPVPTVPRLDLRAFSQICPHCVSFPDPWLHLDCAFGERCIRFGPTPIDGLGAEGGLDANGLDAGFMSLYEGRFTANLESSFEDATMLWVSAEEPPSYLERDAPLFVGIDPLTGELKVVGQVVDGVLSDTLTGSRSFEAQTGESQYVLLGTAGVLVHAKPGDQLELFDVRTSARSTLDLTADLGIVQTLTYAPGETPALLVVDYAYWENRERIVRVDLSTGAVVELADFANSKRTHRLAMTHDDRFVLAGNSEGTLNLVLFSLHGTELQVRGTYEGSATLLSRITADMRGVSYLTKDSLGGWRPEAVVYDALNVPGGSLSSAF